jgi:hypothetical protein
MNLYVFAVAAMSYSVFVGKPGPDKNKYVPYNSALGGGGPHGYYNKPGPDKNKYVPYNRALGGGGAHGYYNKFPKFEYINRLPTGVYGKVVPVKTKPKNNPKNKDSI